MSTNTKPTLILTIILGIAVLLFLIIMVYSFFPKNSNFPQQPRIGGTPTPVQSGNTSSSKKYLISPLEKTSIGKTTDAQIKQSFTVVSEKQDGDTTIYEVNSDVISATNQIRTRGGVVVFESTNTQVSSPTPPKISDLEKGYGKAERTTPRAGEGFYLDAHLYPSKGFMVFANRYTGTVYFVQRFTPMTIAQYESEYAEFLELKEQPKETFN